MAWCCSRCWYRDRFQTAKELGKKFTATTKDGTVEVWFDGEWAGMCETLPPVCPKEGKVSDEAA